MVGMGLAALGPEKYTGQTALGTKMYPGQAAPGTWGMDIFVCSHSSLLVSLQGVLKPCFGLDLVNPRTSLASLFPYNI